MVYTSGSIGISDVGFAGQCLAQKLNIQNPDAFGFQRSSVLLYMFVCSKIYGLTYTLNITALESVGRNLVFPSV